MTRSSINQSCYYLYEAALFNISSSWVPGVKPGHKLRPWGLLAWTLPGGSDGKESACNIRGSGLIPGSGRSPGEGNGNPLQYSCLENSMDRGAWWATVHRVTKCQTGLSECMHVCACACAHVRVHTHTHTHSVRLNLVFWASLCSSPLCIPGA